MINIILNCTAKVPIKLNLNGFLCLVQTACFEG